MHRAGCAGRCLRSGSARRALGGHPSSRTPTSFLQVAKFTRESDSPAEQAGFEPLVPLATASLDYRGGEGAAGRSGLSKRRHCFSRGDQRFESPSLQQRVRVSHRPGRCTSNTPVLRADERCGKNGGVHNSQTRSKLVACPGERERHESSPSPWPIGRRKRCKPTASTASAVIQHRNGTSTKLNLTL